MISIVNTVNNDIVVDETWNFSEDNEYLMHSLHAYPAKFPAFIASKAFDYAQEEGVNVKTVSDIFCGCGTVALEAKLHGKDFWGCDINPVATLIAKTKSDSYQIKALEQHYANIQHAFNEMVLPPEIYKQANERLQYWFTENNYIALYKMKSAINQCVPNSKYKTAFQCILSSILKASSKWLTKSIKPQVDPNKKEADVQKVFSLQYKKFVRAVKQMDNISQTNKIIIKNKNFLTIRNLPRVDLVITSPPYVTSYEYADLHQLSSVWLDFAKDYRDLRQGSIGSVYNSENFPLEIDALNSVGQDIVRQLLANGKPTSKVRSVARYYLDMQHVTEQCGKMLNNGGMTFFVVGDTEYKGVKIMNSEHLIQSLGDAGFSDIKIAKRRISNKLLTPYRDSTGKFSSDKSQRTVYHEELIISGRMWDA